MREIVCSVRLHRLQFEYLYFDLRDRESCQAVQWASAKKRGDGVVVYIWPANETMNRPTDESIQHRVHSLATTFLPCVSRARIGAWVNHAALPEWVAASAGCFVAWSRRLQSHVFEILADDIQATRDDSSLSWPYVKQRGRWYKHWQVFIELKKPVGRWMQS